MSGDKIMKPQSSLLAVLRRFIGFLVLGLAVTQAIAHTPPSVVIPPLPSHIAIVPGTGTNLSLTFLVQNGDGEVVKVEYYDGTTLLGTATKFGPNFVGTWQNVPLGTHTLIAIATDDQGATGTASITFEITANQAPTISLTSPVDGQIFPLQADIPLSAVATDADGQVARVDFYGQNTTIPREAPLGIVTSAPYSLVRPNLPAGRYILTATATDNLNAETTSAPIHITIGAPPTVSLTAPAANTQHPAGGNLTLSADATDSDGTIAQVAFYRNGTLIGTATQIPYTVTWNNLPVGTHSLTAIATDNHGLATTSAPITITVGNSTGSKIYYLHTDHLDTPRAVTDEQGKIVWRNSPLTEPFGNSSPEEDPDGDGIPFVLNLRFPGQYFDRETNTHYNYFRDYDPLTGRYLQSDPIGLEGGINTFAYVGGNPLSYVDPFGLQIALPWVAPLASSIARPGVGTLIDPMVTPYVNPNDPNDGGESDKCRRLREKISNLKKEVFDKRIPDLDANPQNLPQRIGPGEKLSETVRGHEKLLNRQWRRLNELEEQYVKECGC